MYVKRILGDILVVYSYGVWVVFGVFVGLGLPLPFVSLPGWAKIVALGVVGVPAWAVPFAVWMYSLGRVDGLRTRGRRWYYLLALFGWPIGFIFYFRYLRAGIGAGAEGEGKVL